MKKTKKEKKKRERNEVESEICSEESWEKLEGRVGKNDQDTIQEYFNDKQI